MTTAKTDVSRSRLLGIGTETSIQRQCQFQITCNSASFVFAMATPDESSYFAVDFDLRWSCFLPAICLLAKQNKKAEIDTCGVCMEDGALRPCCNRHYCRSCYEGTGNCPGCHLITIGANRGVMNQSKLSSNFEEGGVAAAVIPEGEECRMCLRQGFARKCCGEFYCSECFFRSGYCPNCQVAAEKRIKYQRKPHNPGLVPVLIGYLATLIVSLAALACVAVGVASNSSHITTVFGQTCYGFFPTCLTGPMCVAYTGDTAIGLDAITGWEICDDATTVQKIYGSYCIYDEEVRNPSPDDENARW